MRRAGRTVAQHEQCLLEAAELPPVGVVSPAVLVERPGNVLDKLVRNVERGSIDPAPDPGPRRRGRRHRLAGPDRLHHRPRPTARRRHRAKEGRHRQDEPDDHALDRSRGGLTTTIHLTRDGKGRPLAIPVTHGQRHDSVCARALSWNGFVFSAPAPAGRAAGPTEVIADKGYSFRARLPRRSDGHSAELRLQPPQDITCDRVGDVRELVVPLEELGDVGADRDDPHSGCAHVDECLLDQL